MIQSDALKLEGLAHGFFTRQGGHSTGVFSSLNCGMGSGDDRETVLKNRALVAGRLGIAPDCLLSAWQVHSAEASVVTGPWGQDDRPRVDALVTRTPGIGLGVLTADCGPILFADPQARVIGAAHAGWKGAFGGVVGATVAAMERLGAKRNDIIAVLGPTIGPNAYEVGPEFIATVTGEDEDHARFFRPSGREGHAFFDLPGFIALRAEQAGVGRFVDMGLCTYSDETRFFSYRRTTHRAEPDYGRLISAIALG